VVWKVYIVGPVPPYVMMVVAKKNVETVTHTHAYEDEDESIKSLSGKKRGEKNVASSCRHRHHRRTC